VVIHSANVNIRFSGALYEGVEWLKHLAKYGQEENCFLNINNKTQLKSFNGSNSDKRNAPSDNEEADVRSTSLKIYSRSLT
jgi:hypothetical protein